MNLGIRTRLALVWLALVAGAALVGELYLTPHLDRLLTDRIRDDLFVRLDLCERAASATAAAQADPHEWSRLAHDLGRRAAARVTLIASDGTVIGDSDIEESHLRELENHLHRPEVQAALAGGRGASTRYSATLRQRMMYAAVPYRRDGTLEGVVRVAEPLRQVDEAIAKLRGILATGAAVMLVAALLMSSAAAHWVSRPLRRLTAAAGTMAAGDLSVRTGVAGHDEIARLGQALDRLAGSVSQSLGALRDERDLLDRILTGMHEGVLMLSADGRVALVNPALREMFLLGADVTGLPLLEVIRHGSLKELIDRARTTREAVSEEIVIQGLKPRRVLVHAASLAGEPAGLLAVFVDVTEIRRLESLRRDFVANASHELRTPIASVRSAADTLADALRHEPAAAPGFVEMIQRNSQRLERLVEDLLDLSRIESREFRLNPEPVAPGPLVRRVVSAFDERARERGLRVIVDVPEDLGPVLIDRRALEQILTNLVDNAVKYCTEGAEVRVRAGYNDSDVRLVVEDTGPGIEPRHLPHLFERFYRVDAGRSRELGGTGLGLSIVRNLVEAIGGSVTVESTIGNGSRFVVTLPRNVC